MSKKVVGLMLLLAVGVGATAVWLFQANFAASPAVAAPAQQSGEREMVIAVEEVINGERTAGEVRVTFADSDELPDRPEDAFGVYTGHDGSSLTFGTGAIEVEVGVDVVNDEEPVTTVNASYSGPEERVIFTSETQFLKDTTARPEITTEDIEAGSLIVQRTVEAGSANELGENMIIRVWGHEDDGQLIADVVVYEPIR